MKCFFRTTNFNLLSTQSGHKINLNKSKIFFSRKMSQTQPENYQLTFLLYPKHLLLKNIQAYQLQHYNLNQQTTNIYPNLCNAKQPPSPKNLKTYQSSSTQFLLGIHTTKTKINLINWKFVITPKDLGGLGIPKLCPKNISMLTSLNWHFHHNPDSLQATVLRSKYGHSAIPTSPYYYTLLAKTNSSIIWKSMNHTSHICRSGTSLNIASGKSIHLWNDYWIPPNSSLRQLIQGPIPTNEINSSLSILITNNN